MNMTQWIPAAGIAAACVLCGCLNGADNTIGKRIAQRAAAYVELDNEQQGRVRLGHIQIGDTTNMLWMVHGDPADITASTVSVFAGMEGIDPAELEAAGERELETWTYYRDANPWESGPRLPSPAYQPGAMFADNPPPPPVRVIKTYVCENGVMVGMHTQPVPP